MRQTPSETQSTTTTTRRGRPTQALCILKRDAVSDDTIATPEQEPGNVKTRRVCMLVSITDGWIGSDHTGAFPRVSSRGNKVYLCINPNFFIGIVTKLRHRTELLSAYHKCTSGASPTDLSPFILVQATRTIQPERE